MTIWMKRAADAASYLESLSAHRCEFRAMRTRATCRYRRSKMRRGVILAAHLPRDLPSAAARGAAPQRPAPPPAGHAAGAQPHPDAAGPTVSARTWRRCARKAPRPPCPEIPCCAPGFAQRLQGPRRQCRQVQAGRRSRATRPRQIDLFRITVTGPAAGRARHAWNDFAPDRRRRSTRNRM